MGVCSWPPRSVTGWTGAAGPGLPALRPLLSAYTPGNSLLRAVSSAGAAVSGGLLLTLGEAGLGGASDSVLPQEEEQVKLACLPEATWALGTPSCQAEFGPQTHSRHLVAVLGTCP